MKFKYIFCSFSILIMAFMGYNMNLYLQIFSKVSNQNISNKKCKKINHKYMHIILNKKKYYIFQ